MPYHDVWYNRDRNGDEQEMMAGFSTDGGFRSNGMDATYPPMGGMERHGGGARSEAVAPFDRRMAEDWTGRMEDSDGKRGPHWTMEQAKQIMAQRNIGVDPLEFWVALNAMYSDYCKVFKKHGVGEKLDFYADMAKAFIEDKDAQPDKLARYYEYIVRR